LRPRGPFAPRPARIPLPDTEPVPAHTSPPDPQPYEQRAGDLSVGYIAALAEYPRARKVKKKFPIGFRAPA